MKSGWEEGPQLKAPCMHRSLDRFAKHTQTTFAFMHLQFAFHWLHKLYCTLNTNYTKHTNSIADYANVKITKIAFEFTAFQFAVHQFEHCKLITLHIVYCTSHNIWYIPHWTYYAQCKLKLNKHKILHTHFNSSVCLSPFAH